MLYYNILVVLRKSNLKQLKRKYNKLRTLTLKVRHSTSKIIVLFASVKAR